MKKVALYLANGFEEVEALTVVDLLRRGGIQVTIVGVEEDQVIIGSHDIKVISDISIKDLSLEGYDMIVLPGGMPGTINLFDTELLKSQILDFNRNKKYIAAICAAPLILGRLGLLNKKRVTCYPGVENELLGAFYSEDEDVVIDENIITSRGVGTASTFALELIKILKGDEVFQDIKKQILL